VKRDLAPQIETDLTRKMVFVTGPRQVGKTTVAKSLLTGNRAYFNGETDEGRRAPLARGSQGLQECP
jgi:predicted AAA+ superfamily ATPase